VLLPSPAAALAVVLPPHQHIATGAIQRRWDGRIDIGLSDGARELDPALVARLDHLGRKRFLYANTGRLETLQENSGESGARQHDDLAQAAFPPGTAAASAPRAKPPFVSSVFARL
jgi:hypothetical protein